MLQVIKKARAWRASGEKMDAALLKVGVMMVLAFLYGLTRGRK
jgi:hypothetical protein